MSEPHPEIRIVDELGVVDAVLRTHDSTECALPYCAIHDPSDHPLRDAPQRWRNDLLMLERVCPHGFGHPDIDNLDYIFEIYGEMAASVASVHTCDGCCGLFLTGNDAERGDDHAQ
jgi:hypothetical protein